MSPAEPTSLRHLGGLITPILLLALTAGVGFLAVRILRLEQRLEDRLTAVQAATDAVAGSVGLMRVEAERNMTGVHAVIAQIEHWAPQLIASATAASLLSDMRNRLETAVQLAAELDPQDFDAMEEALVRSDDAETKRWLLRAAVRVDDMKGKALCAALVRGIRHQPSGLLRTRAADILLELDPQLAGLAIHDVLEFESTRGLSRNLPPSRREDYENYLRGDRFPQYLNFIERFVRSDHSDVEGTLRQLLASDDHDRMTYQEVVKQLGKLESRSAVPRIKSLIEKPPFGHQHPLFEAHCLQALADIQGRDARDYLQDRLALPGHQELVVKKLQTLLKQI